MKMMLDQMCKLVFVFVLLIINHLIITHIELASFQCQSVGLLFQAQATTRTSVWQPIINKVQIHFNRLFNGEIQR